MAESSQGALLIPSDHLVGDAQTRRRTATYVSASREAECPPTFPMRSLMFRSAAPRLLATRRRQVSAFLAAAVAMSSLTAVEAISSTPANAAKPAPITVA